MKALSLSIYEAKNLGNCSNNGISNKFSSVLLIHNEGFINIDENNIPENLVILKESYIAGKKYMYLEPYKQSSQNTTGYMFGGSYASTSDSRFNDISKYPLPIHDRQETWEMYNSFY